MTDDERHTFEMRQLLYFEVAAEELNLHRASERLLISQPPLSRQIKALEEKLGFNLFKRHTRGLELTEEGRKVMRQIKPLVDLYRNTCADLSAMSRVSDKAIRVGFTTAFEQGRFTAIEQILREFFPEGLALSRQTSPRLVREVEQGRLDLALVAMPLETRGLENATLGYEEPLVLALPAVWTVADKKRLSLRDLNDRALFWFRRDANPAYYDYCKAVFTQARFMPRMLEEPVEHDVLLGRIAAGEAAGLFAASFSAIRREGVVFKDFAESGLLRIRMGIVTNVGGHSFFSGAVNRLSGMSW